MQAARLKFFVEEIRRDAALAAHATMWTVYIKKGDRWATEELEDVKDSELSQLLENVLNDGTYWRPTNSYRAYFPVQQLSLVLAANFPSPPRNATQKRTAAGIKRALKHSLDAFNANHDVLTGAPNRVAFDRKLTEAIDTAAAKAAGSSDVLTAAEIAAPSVLALLALDIDYFKQLNDTYGHLYGDVVLQIFTRRLNHCLLDLERRFGERLQTDFSRLGGEEFGILARGSLSANDLIQIAEDIRSAIADTPLPTDDEWAALNQSNAITSLSLPHISDRRVTISVGVAVLPPTPISHESRDTASQLRSNADAALFRAKSGGRNTVRHYSDILDHHGRVLQHHSATGLVAIDIGRTVGISVGQEFTAFHPDFVGDRPFLYDDGRTQKRLGRYPRYPCARLLVIDAQQELSFCRVISTDLLTPIPAGSHLELVPVGSIAHLIQSELKLDVIGGPVLALPEGLPKIIQDMTAAKAPIQTAVVTLLDVDKLAKERGTAFVNSALAHLYGVLREIFPINKAIAQILPTQFAIILSDTDPSKLTSNLREVIAKASDRSAGLATFRAGAYWPESYAKPFKGDKSLLRPENSLEYARFAIAHQEPDPGPVCIFTPAVAFNVISAWRNKQRHREAITDYHLLRQLGVEYASIENIISLSALSTGENEKSLALEAISRATSLLPDNPLFRANQAYIECVFGDRVHSWKLFSDLPASYTLAEVYLPRRAQALAAAYTATPDVISIDLVKDTLQEALALSASSINRTIRIELQTFLDSISTPPEQ